MKLIIALALVLSGAISNTLNSQVFLVNLDESGFTFNENILNSNDKACYVLNCLSKEYIKSGGFPIKPLLVFKVFEYTGKRVKIAKPSACILLNDYLKKTVLGKLVSDMWLKADNLTSANSDPNTFLIDSLVIYDGQSHFWIDGGICIEEFFNVYPFQQVNLLQTNQSIFNTQSLVSPIHSWTADSLPIPEVEEMLGGKMFLLRKDKDEYTFFRHRFDCSDCTLSFYNEYVYKKDYGVIGFMSKYLQYNNNATSREMSGKIIESDKYYRFK